MLEHLNKVIETDYSNTVGLVVLKNDQKIFENYYNGFNKGEAIHITSVTKSITSLLMGIAVDHGFIQSIDQKVLDFFPTYVLKRGEKTIQNITIKHLLTMTAPYKFKSEPYSKVYSSADWTKAALDLLGGKGTIGDFKYNTVGIHILSGIISEATGKSLLEFADEYLLTPLGIHKPKDLIIQDRSSYMAFIKYSGENVWIHDPSGCYTGGWGLTLNANDMAKLGQLAINKGQWQGKQLISSNWIAESTKVQSEWQEYSYGYLWWIIDDNSFAAIGDGGNIIYVDTSNALVVSITSTFKPRYEDRITLIKDHILPYL